MSGERENRSAWLRRRRVLRLLADTPHGRADLKMIARFSIEIFGLITSGLVEMHSEIATEHGRTIETACVRITAAGRRALQD
jgi:hypothetical protein